MDRTLSGATTSGPSGPGNDATEGVLHGTQSSNITEASPAGFLGSYTGHLLGKGVNLSAVMQLVYFIASADWSTRTLVEEVLPLCRVLVGVYYSPSRMVYWDIRWGVVLPPLHRCSLCILQPQLTGPPGHSLRELLPICRDDVGVFYSPSWLVHQDTR